jgi:NAD kinase
MTTTSNVWSRSALSLGDGLRAVKDTLHDVVIKLGGDGITSHTHHRTRTQRDEQVPTHTAEAGSSFHVEAYLQGAPRKGTGWIGQTVRFAGLMHG